jgi:hypothetical protein
MGKLFYGPSPRRHATSLAGSRLAGSESSLTVTRPAAVGFPVWAGPCAAAQRRDAACAAARGVVSLAHAHSHTPPGTPRRAQEKGPQGSLSTRTQSRS